LLQIIKQVLALTEKPQILIHKEFILKLIKIIVTKIYVFIFICNSKKNLYILKIVENLELTRGLGLLVAATKKECKEI